MKRKTIKQLEQVITAHENDKVHLISQLNKLTLELDQEKQRTERTRAVILKDTARSFSSLMEAAAHGIKYICDEAAAIEGRPRP